MHREKNIRPELFSGRETGTLEERPPIGVKSNLPPKPMGDGLLRDGRMASLTQLHGKRLLATAGGLDRSSKSENMRRGVITYLHEHPKYTSAFVSSTSGLVSQEHKGVCTVLSMAAPKSAALRKPSRRPKAEKERRALPGPDGKTLGQRVSEAMAYKSGRIGREYRAVDLLEDVNKLAHATPADPFLSQQMLSEILRNRVTKTSKAPFIALACGVSVSWLIQGVGRMTDSNP